MKKGFTLIEMLAVIIVLAVIAVIAIPIVANVIESGKIGATENSTNIYIKEVETKFSEWSIEGIPTNLGAVSEGDYIIIDVQKLNSVLNLDGDVPTVGTIKIDNNYSLDSHFFGYVIDAELTFDNGYKAVYQYDVSENFQGNRATIEIQKSE